MRRKKTSKEKLAVLVETGDALMQDLDLEVLLVRILEKVRELFGVDRCAVLQVDEAAGRLRMLKAVGYAPEVGAQFSLRVGEGISGWVASAGMPAFVPDVRRDLRYVPGVPGAVSEFAVPLVRGSKVVGVLDVESTRSMKMEEVDMELLHLFAGQAAAALHNASLLAALKRSNEQLDARVRELQILNHVGKLLGELLPLEEELAEILRLAGDVLQFQACAVLLPDEEDGEVLRIRAARGYPAEVVRTARIRKGEGVTGEVFRSGRARLVQDVAAESRYIPGVVGGRCEMACPLLARGRILGVIDAEGREPGSFDEQKFVLFTTFASQAAVAIRNAQMYERTQTTYYQTIRSLANALEARDSYTRGHSERVTNLGVEIGRRLGLAERELDVIRQAGLLHDIGKIGVRDEVLNKASSLSAVERSKINEHPGFGNMILGQLRFLHEASKAILHHHERFDGRGYPSGLLGSEIPLVARVIAVADAWDAMTSDRPYRDAMERESALNQVRQNAGAQFDPDVVRAFLDVLDARDRGGDHGE